MPHENSKLRELHQKLPPERGVAFADYVDAIVSDPRSIATRARQLVVRFEEKVSSFATSDVGRDIVAKFGVLYAGGVIAIEAGILPFTPAAVGAATRKASVAALRALPAP